MDQITVAVDNMEGWPGSFGIEESPDGIRLTGYWRAGIGPAEALMSPVAARAIALALNLAATAHEGRAHDANGRCLDPVRFGCPDMPH